MGVLGCTVWLVLNTKPPPGPKTYQKSRCDNPLAARFPLDREVVRYLKQRFGA